jgi:hypothetical protein
MPGSTLRVLAAKGHCPHMSAPEETIAAMREYLAAGSARGAGAGDAPGADAHAPPGARVG